jgi:ABC-type nitrate/sulfonate/bicarbonate transport system ATPase subunit
MVIKKGFPVAPAVAIGAADAGVEIHQLSKWFAVDEHRIQALDRVSLTVKDGEFLTLLGPSGCGKSTLLRMLAGLDVPDEGDVAVYGVRVERPSLSRGIVFQDHRLLPWLTVRENIVLSLHKSGLSPQEQDARVSELIALVGLTGFDKAKPYQLSGGMSQRAAIARALAPRPRILLLDEPLGALDSLTRTRLQNELVRLWEAERITVVMVTHDVEEAVYLSSRVVVMEPRPGRIQSIIDIDLPRPRKRTDVRLVTLREQILTSLE